MSPVTLVRQIRRQGGRDVTQLDCQEQSRSIYNHPFFPLPWRNTRPLPSRFSPSSAVVFHRQSRPQSAAPSDLAPSVRPSVGRFRPVRRKARRRSGVVNRRGSSGRWAGGRRTSAGLLDSAGDDSKSPLKPDLFPAQVWLQDSSSHKRQPPHVLRDKRRNRRFLGDWRQQVVKMPYANTEFNVVDCMPIRQSVDRWSVE